MSLKRQMVKKSEEKHLRKKLTLQSPESLTEMKNLKRQAKSLKDKNKTISRELGVKNLRNVHLEKYPEGLKALIGKLNDESLNEIKLQKKELKPIGKAGSPNKVDADPDFSATLMQEAQNYAESHQDIKEGLKI